MKKRFPPPLLMAFTGICMYVTAALIPSLKQVGFRPPFVGEAIMLIGVALVALSTFYFRHAKTTINPYRLNDSNTLITGGPFRISRNPIYLGMALVLVGLAIKLSHPVNIVWIWVFVFYLTKTQIALEEKAMIATFGGAYTDYMSRVRRWI